MQPLFSICIPTFNRAELLDLCLERLQALESFGKPFEIVVSDNASTDDTRQRVESRQSALPQLRYSRQAVNVGVLGNLQNALRRATGRFVIYLADDDALIPEGLIRHVERMERESDLAALYADWIAYDDEQERELHRYFRFDRPVTFGRDDPLGLVNFVLANRVYPEIAVYRREALLQAIRHVKHALPFHLWMYGISRLGRVAFELAPFYRENRVLKKRFQRAHWSNIELQLDIIGDEQRNTLESVALLALQDAGYPKVPEDQAVKLRVMIDRFLHARITLEVQRAVAARNWILALELRQRQILWYGPGNAEEQGGDLLRIALPAALQSVQETYRCLSDVGDLVLRDFQSDKVAEFFRTQFPDIPVVSGDGGARSTGNRCPLILYRESGAGSVDAGGETLPGYVLHLDRLLQVYRIGTVNLSFAGL